MIRSMTGFASAEGALDAFTWSWELRAVNGRGLDLRLRVPDWVDGLETALRKRLSDSLGRGSVTLSLRLNRSSDASSMSLNEDVLQETLAIIARVEEAALEQDVSLASTTAADVLALRGVLESAGTTTDSAATAALRKALVAQFETVLSAFEDMRVAEGEVLHKVLSAHLDEIEALTKAATDAAEARREPARDALQTALARIMDQATEIGEDRIVQELALLAVKADVTEELHRLGAHVSAARALLDGSGPVGRKFDFLMQEFNREANTLCSKSGDRTLTTIGLDLKTKIDQLREQVQNVE